MAVYKYESQFWDREDNSVPIDVTIMAVCIVS